MQNKDDYAIDNRLLELYISFMSLSVLQDQFFPICNLKERIAKELNSTEESKKIEAVLNQLENDGYIRVSRDSSNNISFFGITAGGEELLNKLQCDIFVFFLLCKPWLSNKPNIFQIEENFNDRD